MPRRHPPRYEIKTLGIIGDPDPAQSALDRATVVTTAALTDAVVAQARAIAAEADAAAAEADAAAAQARALAAQADANTAALSDALRQAIASGLVSVEVTITAGQPPTLRAVTTPGLPGRARICPGCGRARVRTGAMAPLGPEGALVETCDACSSVSRAVDAAFRRDPMREDWS